MGIEKDLYVSAQGFEGKGGGVHISRTPAMFNQRLRCYRKLCRCHCDTQWTSLWRVRMRPTAPTATIVRLWHCWLHLWVWLFCSPPLLKECFPLQVGPSSSPINIRPWGLWAGLKLGLGFVGRVCLAAGMQGSVVPCLFAALHPCPC